MSPYTTPSAPRIKPWCDFASVCSLPCKATCAIRSPGIAATWKRPGCFRQPGGQLHTRSSRVKCRLDRVFGKKIRALRQVREFASGPPRRGPSGKSSCHGCPQVLELLRDEGDRRPELLFAMIDGDEEAQARGVLGDRRVDDWLDIDASL